MLPHSVGDIVAVDYYALRPGRHNPLPDNLPGEVVGMVIGIDRNEVLWSANHNCSRRIL